MLDMVYRTEMVCQKEMLRLKEVVYIGIERKGKERNIGGVIPKRTLSTQTSTHYVEAYNSIVIRLSGPRE